MAKRKAQSILLDIRGIKNGRNHGHLCTREATTTNPSTEIATPFSSCFFPPRTLLFTTDRNKSASLSLSLPYPAKAQIECSLHHIPFFPRRGSQSDAHGLSPPEGGNLPSDLQLELSSLLNLCIQLYGTH